MPAAAKKVPARADAEVAASPLGHGASRLTTVVIDSYNIALRDEEGFLGDRACKGAFCDILGKMRKPLAKLGNDPFDDTQTEELTKKELDTALDGDDQVAAGLLHGAVEAFAQEFAAVVRRIVKAKGWRETEFIVVGGGMSDSRYGARAIARADVLVKSAGCDLDLAPIRHHPDEAGLIGAVHLAPPWIFEAHDSILAVDIGGTNFRAGVVDLNLKKARNLAKAVVWKRELWRHADDKPSRTEAVERLVAMIEKLIAQADKEDRRLAPFIGIGCPGLIEPDGDIAEGAQNLPGNWESSRFNLPRAIAQAIPLIGDHETVVLMHNDAVVQGLSEVPFMREHERWGVLTIGTGLGNARFTNRPSPAKD